ncbi:MAG: Arc family DNA-binding protein [Oscillospiraceae bacterium]|nr:Arc family DNA-binding protein [Oscillospiraceae bacterium]
MDDKLLRYTLRIDRQLFAKFRYVAEYNGRSANKELEQMMKRRVEKFEKEHEVIILDEKE